MWYYTRIYTITFGVKKINFTVLNKIKHTHFNDDNAGIPFTTLPIQMVIDCSG